MKSKSTLEAGLVKPYHSIIPPTPEGSSCEYLKRKHALIAIHAIEQVGYWTLECNITPTSS